MSQFQVWPYRFHLRTLDPAYFPAHQAGNHLRGAFGTIFRDLACPPQCPGQQDGPHAESCIYAQVFEPHWAGGPSGLADAPRGFVFRPASLEGRHFAPGDEFHFDLHLFSGRADLLSYFEAAFQQLAQQGLGRGRPRAQLLRVAPLDCQGRESDAAGWAIDFKPRPAIGTLRLRFLSPTELKGTVSGRPELEVLIRRLMDRIGNLAVLYQGCRLTLDVDPVLDAAARVRLASAELAPVAADRRSTRTGQTHSLGGWIGHLDYAGDFTLLLPWLEAARWTGVGRQTVWGKGWVEVATAGTAETPVIA